MSTRNLILFDDDNWRHLLPLTFVRPVSELRIGILTLREKWERLLNAKASYITQDHLADKYPVHLDNDNILINSACLPTEKLMGYISKLKLNEAILNKEEFIAARLDRHHFDQIISGNTIESINGIDISNEEHVIKKVCRPYHVFQYNGAELVSDFNLVTKGRTSKEISQTNSVIGQHPVFLEEGVEMECCMINSKEGPIYIGKDAHIMEGAMIRGPIAICENAVVKMGAKLYNNTTIGPNCKVGGEIQNSVIFANSNKAHDGYLGNSVICEWCNLGADTNTSNLKNNYDTIKLWSYPEESFLSTGLTFCGLIMADHSKTGINTMFNTGTVVGVCANIFGDGYPRNFIASFTWGGAAKFITHQFIKAAETAKIVMARRGIELSEADSKILEYVYYESAKYRPWDTN